MGKQPPIYSFRKKKKPVKSRSEEEAVRKIAKLSRRVNYQRLRKRG